MARIFYYGLKTRLNSQGDEIYGSDNFCDAKFQLLRQPWDVLGVSMGMPQAEELIKWAGVQTNYFIVAFPTYAVQRGGTTEFKDAIDALPEGRGMIINRVSKTGNNIGELLKVAREKATGVKC